MTEAERLAQALDGAAASAVGLRGLAPISRADLFAAAAELRRLSAEAPVLHDCIESLKATAAEQEAEIRRLRKARDTAIDQARKDTP